MDKYPKKYSAIAANLKVLRSEEPAFRKVYGDIKGVIPDAVFPPTYFVVAGHRGIGSGSIEGPLISIEKKTAESIRGDLAATLVHEMVHMEQLAALNRPTSRSSTGRSELFSRSASARASPPTSRS